MQRINLISLMLELLPLLVIIGFFGYQWLRIRAYRRAAALYAQGDMEGALAAFERRLRLARGDANAYLGRASVWANLGKPEKAIEDYTKVIQLKPKLVDIRRMRGFVYLMTGEYEAARADFDAVIRAEPENVPAHLHRGRMHEIQGNLDAAEADYSRAIDLARGCLDKTQKFGAYMPAAKQSSTLYEQQLVEGYIRRGHLRQQHGQIGDAQADFALLEQRQPSDLTGYSTRAAAYQDVGEYERAAADYTAMLKLAPYMMIAYNDRGEAYFALGEWEAARRDFQKAHTALPQLTYAMAGLALACHALGQIDEARRLWEALVSQDARFRDVDWVRRRLNWKEPLAAEARKLVTALDEIDIPETA